MTGFCEGGKEPPGSLKAIRSGRKARRLVRKELLTCPMKLKRLTWARKYQNWTQEDRKSVVFSDESDFVVLGLNVSHVRRSDEEKLTSKYIKQTVKLPQKKMFWDCFELTLTKCLIPIDGIMNSDKQVHSNFKVKSCPRTEEIVRGTEHLKGDFPRPCPLPSFEEIERLHGEK
ncbi:hypothetical protein ANN_18985 [Periplaneta americana]|uniref:Uncharacterized protein n=1 Tax=Periplaneta americana TaxID=6978 RepID=A0ABQ8SR00_PERAM|nr:hypothetical protein ANN_18985 [Periplaneta americana]